MKENLGGTGCLPLRATSRSTRLMRKYRPNATALSKSSSLITTIESEEIDKLRADYQGTLRNRATPAYMQYIENSLQKLYRDGIISTQDMDELKKEEYPRINLLAGSVAHPHYSSDGV